MRELEKWIWLAYDKYPNSQTTIFHHDAVPPAERDEKGNYTVAEFVKTYKFDKKVKMARLRFSGDTEFELTLNKEVIATGPVNIGGDFLFNHICRSQHYATELTVYPNSNILDFYARVKMMPILINEYSKGHGGFMLTAHLEFEDGTIGIVTTDKTWKARKNAQYVEPFVFDASIQPDAYSDAQEVQNIWYPENSEIPLRTEEVLYPNGGGLIQISAGERKEVILEYDKVYGAFLTLSVRTQGTLKVSVNCFELQVENSKEEFVFVEDTEYRGLQMHSVGGYRVVVENQSDSDADIKIGAIATCYPAPECAITRTSDDMLNKVLELCTQALKYCRQTIHLDSPKHCEPLACTGDYYIETLMTAFSFGDMRLAEFDVRRTAELLRYYDGRIFHTTYSCIWVMMAYDTYMFTGNKQLLIDCVDALVLLLNRFESYVGDNGIVEHATDYLFIDWLDVDGMTLHHPPKNLGQGCLNMFYYGALIYAAKIYEELAMEAMAEECLFKAEKLKQAINETLFNEEVGLYCEGLGTPTAEEELNPSLPQSNGKIYYRKHANILAACYGVCEGERAKQILRRVVVDDSLGGCQPYFMHFLLEAIYRNGLREELTLKVLEEWKVSAAECGKGLQEGFVLPENYTFDLSHAWGGTPLYSLPKALLGFEMVKPGFEEIKLSPSLLGLSSASVEMLTPYGKILYQQKQNEEMIIDVPKEIAVRKS